MTSESEKIKSKPLFGKVALVTGASRGLGRAIALALGQAGAAVAVTDLLIEDAEYNAQALDAFSPLAGHFYHAGEVRTLETANGLESLSCKEEAPEAYSADSTLRRPTTSQRSWR